MIASYLSSLGARMTSEKQVAALTAFAEAQKGLFGSSDATLQSTVGTAQYELYWDSQYLATVASIVDKKVKGGAIGMSMGVSAVLVACGVLLNSLLMH